MQQTTKHDKHANLTEVHRPSTDVSRFELKCFVWNRQSCRKTDFRKVKRRFGVARLRKKKQRKSMTTRLQV